MSEITKQYIIGHLDWNSRIRFILGLTLACVLVGTLGFMIVRPWDPQGAICLQFVNNNGLFLFRLMGLLLVTGIFATIIMDARLPLFGTFATSIGLGIPILKTAGMSYVMVRLQAGKEFEHPQDLWPYMIMESLAWSIVLVVLVAGTMATEYWLKKNTNGELLSDQPNGDIKSSKKKPAAFKIPWLKGLGGTLITVILSLFLISVFAGDCEKGQVVFSVIAGFFVAALLAEQIAENGHPVWQVAACPIVAILAYAYTWQNPTRPPGLEALLNIAPTHLAWVLPVEYIFIGPIGAIFGTWTSERMRYNKSHG
jgi:hypothetical protein